MPLVIRRADPRDLTAVTFFVDTCLRNDYFFRTGHLQAMLASARHRVSLIILDDALVGLAITTRPATLVNLLIHPAYRGLGIGTTVLKHVNPSAVRCKTDMSTGDPGRFYAKNAFRPHARPTRIRRLTRR